MDNIFHLKYLSVLKFCNSSHSLFSRQNSRKQVLSSFFKSSCRFPACKNMSHYTNIRRRKNRKLSWLNAISFLIFMFSGGICLVYSLLVITTPSVKTVTTSLLAIPVDDDSGPFIPFTNYRTAVLSTSKQDFWQSITPSFRCPSEMKVGVVPKKYNTGSNGMFVCGRQKLGKISKNKSIDTWDSPNCLVYSFTLEGNSFFEVDLLKNTKCSVNQFDSLRRRPGPPMENHYHSRFHFRSNTVGDQSKDRLRMLTLELIMGLMRHSWLDILRIELPNGMEYKVLEKMLYDFRDRRVPVGQLIVKFDAKDWVRYRKLKI